MAEECNPATAAGAPEPRRASTAEMAERIAEEARCICGPFRLSRRGHIDTCPCNQSKEPPRGR